MAHIRHKNGDPRDNDLANLELVEDEGAPQNFTADFASRVAEPPYCPCCAREHLSETKAVRYRCHGCARYSNCGAYQRRGWLVRLCGVCQDRSDLLGPTVDESVKRLARFYSADPPARAEITPSLIDDCAEFLERAATLGTFDARPALLIEADALVKRCRDARIERRDIERAARRDAYTMAASIVRERLNPVSPAPFLGEIAEELDAMARDAEAL